MLDPTARLFSCSSQISRFVTLSSMMRTRLPATDDLQSVESLSVGAVAMLSLRAWISSVRSRSRSMVSAISRPCAPPTSPAMRVSFSGRTSHASMADLSAARVPRAAGHHAGQRMTARVSRGMPPA